MRAEQKSETIQTICPGCGVGCGVNVENPRGDARVSGDADHPANFGRLCVKGAALAQTLNHEERLLYPHIHGARAGWEEALDLVAENFRKTIAEHGPDSVALLVSGQLLTEDLYVANKLMKGFIGAANIDSTSRLGMLSSAAGRQRAFGSDTAPGVYEDLDEADLVVLVGSNLAWGHPVLYRRLAEAREKRGGWPKIVNIDPRRTATSEIADLHLSLAPGSDVALFHGLLRALQKEGKRDRKFVAAHTRGADAALAVARKWTEEKVAARTGLPLAELRRFYDLVIEHDKTVTLTSQGVNQSCAGTDKVNAILNAHLLTGRIGKPGCGPFSVAGQPNAMGASEVGALADRLAAHMNLDNGAHRALVQKFWNAPRIAQKPGLKAVELFQEINDGSVKAVWIVGANPADSMPDADFVRGALKKCPFVVVSEAAAPTGAGALAHVLLPAQAWGEKDGTMTNSERRISRQRGFRESPGEARADWRAICDVAKRLGFAEGFAFDGPAAIFREHAALSGVENNGTRDFDISAFAQIGDAEYDALAPFQWPCPAGAGPDEGPKRFFADGKFFTDSGRAQFVATEFRTTAGKTDAQHPFLLNTGRVGDQWDMMARNGRAQNLSQPIAEPCAEINPLDAARAGIEPGGLVRVGNERGSVILRARITERQRRGSLFAPVRWSEKCASKARVGALIAPHVDPVSGQPESKATPVAVEALHPAFHAFVLTRKKPQNLDGPYWALARIEGGWRIELAGMKPLADADFFARNIFALDAAPECEVVAVRDEKLGTFRCVASRNGEILGAIFIAPAPVDVARSWLCEQFAQSESDPLALLAGGPPRATLDPGRKICVCLHVGAQTILDAIACNRLSSVDSVGAATGAGTGCGSCKPEIESLLKSRAPAANPC